MAKLYLPSVHHSSPLQAAAAVCGMNEQAAGFAVLWRTHILQRRAEMVCDERLVQAAQRHAEDMVLHNHASHTGSDGRSPNERVRAAGYRLPSWYPQVGNQVESLSVRWQGVAENLERLLESPGHYPHVSGSDSFYAEQTVYGVGYAEGGRLVLITAPPEQG